MAGRKLRYFWYLRVRLANRNEENHNRIIEDSIIVRTTANEDPIIASSAIGDDGIVNDAVVWDIIVSENAVIIVAWPICPDGVSADNVINREGL